MNYLLLYKKLIRKAQRRQQNNPKWFKDKHNKRLPGHELHHIIPKCELIDRKRPKKIWNGKWNKIMLTAREHFIAHRLLHKVCLRVYGEHHRLTNDMLYAINCMANRISMEIITSKTYQYIHQNFSTAYSKEMKDRWKNDEDFRNSTNNSRNKYFKENAAQISSDRSLRGKKLWANPEYRTKKMQSVFSQWKGGNNPGSKSYKLISPAGIEYIVNGTLVDFCKEYNLSYGSLTTMERDNKPMPIRPSKRGQSRNTGWSIFKYDTETNSTVKSDKKLDISPPRIKYKLVSPSNETFLVVYGKFTEFCRYHNLSLDNLMKALRSKTPMPLKLNGNNSKNSGWSIYYYDAENPQ